MNVKDLHAGAINVESIHKDWSEGWAETWDFFESQECYQCGKVFVGGDECPKCGVTVDRAEGPMMNYFYPLPGFDPNEVGGVEMAALRLDKAGAVCLVELLNEDEDKWGLALTGGGMNLSWDICAGYVALGYLPPLYFLDSLPNFAGMSFTSKAKKVLAAGRRTCRVAQIHVRQTKIRINEVQKRLQENTAKRKVA